MIKKSSLNSRTAVSIQNISVFYGDECALSDVCLDVEKGDYLGIIGPNGGGKTTLLKAMLGLVPISTGTVEIYGRKRGHTGRLVGYVPQITSLEKNFPITVHEVVMTGRLYPSLTVFHKYSTGDNDTVEELLDGVGILKLKNRLVSQLSGGEFQKMLIARALAVKPRLLLLDEPTASVDASSRSQIYELLGELNANMTIILVTHDLVAVSSQLKSLACLNRKLVYHGGTKIDEEVVQKLYGCPIDLIAHGVPHRVLKEHGEDD